MLMTNLTGNAKPWLQLQSQATKDSYAAFRQGLKDHFSPSKEAIFTRKLPIWGSRTGVPAGLSRND